MYPAARAAARILSAASMASNGASPQITYKGFKPVSSWRGSSSLVIAIKLYLAIVVAAWHDSSAARSVAPCPSACSDKASFLLLPWRESGRHHKYSPGIKRFPQRVSSLAVSGHKHAVRRDTLTGIH